MRKMPVLKMSAASALLAVASIALLASSSGTAAVQSTNATSLFASKCALCHAKDGAGISTWKAKGQPDFTNSDWQKSRTDAQIAETIHNGKGKFMPSFKAKLTEEQMAALVKVVRGFGKR